MTVVSVRPGNETPVGVRPAGPPGPAPVLTIGTVTSGDAPDVTINPAGVGAYTIDFVLEEGPAGPASTVPGPANKLSIGTVSSGETATATITGSAPNQTLNLVLPNGEPGPANSLKIGTVTKGTAAATITGTAPDQTLDLVLPPGDNGVTPALVAGTVTTLPAGSSATASLTPTGTPNEYALNLGLPAGEAGAPGAGSGSGDVVGPSSSVNNRIVLFNGTTGKLIKDAGVLLSDLATAAQGGKADSAIQAAGTNFSNTGLRVRDTDASHSLIIAPGSNLTADRTLTLSTGDANRTFSMGGNITIANAFATSGAFAITLTATAATNVTLPASGTLATTAQLPSVATSAEVITGTDNAKIATAKALADASATKATSSGSGSYAVSFAATYWHERTLTGNSTISTPTGARLGVTYLLDLKQDGTGGRTGSFSTNIDFGAAGAPTLSTGAGKIDRMILTCIDATGGNQKFFGTFKKAAA